LANIENDYVELCAVDPRAARFINESRLGPQLRGFSTRRVIEAFMLVRSPRRCRVNISDDRRLITADVLREQWQIECDDLLSERRRVRLVSSWTIGDEVSTNACANALPARSHNHLTETLCGGEVIRGS